MSNPGRTNVAPEESPLQITVQIPLAERQRKALLILGVTAAGRIFAWGVQFATGELIQYWWCVWPIPLIGLGAAFAIRYNATKTVITDAGKAARQHKLPRMRATMQK